MKKYFTLFALGVSVVGLAITIDRNDWFMVFVIMFTTHTLQLIITICR